LPVLIITSVSPFLIRFETTGAPYVVTVRTPHSVDPAFIAVFVIAVSFTVGTGRARRLGGV